MDNQDTPECILRSHFAPSLMRWLSTTGTGKGHNPKLAYTYWNDGTFYGGHWTYSTLHTQRTITERGYRCYKAIWIIMK